MFSTVLVVVMLVHGSVSVLPPFASSRNMDSKRTVELNTCDVAIAAHAKIIAQDTVPTSSSSLLS